MKKIMALLMSFCMLAMLVPAMAEGESGGNLGALQGLLDSASDGESSGALSGLVGSLLSGSETEDGESEGADVGALLGMVGGLLGGSGDGSAEPTYTAVAADSIDQFFGAWVFEKAAVGGMELTPSLLALLGTTGSAQMTIENGKISMDAVLGELEKSYEVDSTEESKYVIDMALVDGALNVTMEGETFTFQLTDADELVCAVEELGTVFFTRAE